MTWKVKLDLTAEKELSKLEHQQAKRILKFLFERISRLHNPRSIGEALRGSKLDTFWKYRVGDYRIISNIDDKNSQILILRIGNRKEIYR